jgi:D-amino-acid dehydrogenase
LIDWGFKFIKSANNKKVEAAAVPLRDIAILSQQEYKAWNTLPGFDFAWQQKGLLEIFQTPAAAGHAHQTVAKGKELGLDVELLDYEQLQNMEPHTKINGMGAVFFKSDSHLYPNKLMRSLLTYLKQQGVQLMPNEEVTGFEKEGKKIKKIVTASRVYEADEVIVATGAWSREMAAMMETKIPLMPGRGYSITLENSKYHLNYPAILVEGRVAITPMDGNKMRFGGTMEVVPTQAPPRYQRVEGILNAVKRFIPEFDIAMPPNDKIWYGYRPCSADGLPYIGRISNYKNVIVATGHAMLGLSLGAGTGKLVNELVSETTMSMDISPFAVERFG